MKCTWFYFINDNFLSVRRQIHVIIDGQFYRIFGTEDREIRRVESATKQPKIQNKKIINQLLEAVDNFAQVI